MISQVSIFLIPIACNNIYIRFRSVSLKYNDFISSSSTLLFLFSCSDNTDNESVSCFKDADVFDNKKSLFLSGISVVFFLVIRSSVGRYSY